MTDLSPAAQAVLTASAKAQCLYEWSTVNDPPCHPSDQEWNGCGDCLKRPAIAAALRAAADQVVPEDYDPPTKHDEFVRGMVAGKTLRNIDVHAALRRIAAELDGGAR